jgi:hypothetical protein
VIQVAKRHAQRQSGSVIPSTLTLIPKTAISWLSLFFYYLKN